MFRIGDSLREARARRGLTPAEVHKAIRIRERYLTALEEERWDMLPGEAYTKGFLRTYADYLGLDGQLYVDEFNTRIARHDDDAPPVVVRASARAGRRLGRGIAVALVVVVAVGAAVGGLAAWRLGGSSAPPRTDGVADAATTAPRATTPRPKSSPKPPAVRAVLTSISATRGRCWLLVRNGGPTGAIVFEGVLEQGQAKRFRFASRLWVRMGRPDALDITVGGKPIAATLPGTPANIVLTQDGAA